ncbi:MAG: glycosyltransferase family 39 protein [Candidatus Omnitrophica bacterium]|nr:glycosyltransferase family 39 protein [Candidatus Omnitrophota bacterium]
MLNNQKLSFPFRGLSLIFLLYLPFYLFQINQPILDTYSFRQTQTASIARNFYRNGINLLKTELDIFGPGEEKFFILEFPFYQAVVATLYRIFGLNELWGRVVSVIMGYTGALFLFLLIRLFSENLELAYLSVFIYLGIPINLHFNRTFIMDPMVVTLILIFLYCFSAGILANRPGLWLGGLVVATLAFVHKGIYGPFFLLPVIYLCISNRHRTKNWRLLLLSLTLPLAILFRWYLHTAAINMATGQGNLTLGDPAFRVWNFGLLEDRFRWQMWVPRLINLFPEFFTPVSFIPTLVGTIRLPVLKNNKFFSAMLAASVIYFLTIFRLQDCHYYQLLISPVAAIVAAHGVIVLSGYIPEKGRRVFLSCFCFLFLVVSIPLAYRYRFFQPEVLEITRVIKSYSSSNEPVAFCLPEYDWNSQYVYYADRKGIVLASSELNKHKVRFLVRKGYRLLVLVDQKEYINRANIRAILKTLTPLLQEPSFSLYRLKNG